MKDIGFIYCQKSSPLPLKTVIYISIDRQLLKQILEQECDSFGIYMNP